MITGGNYTTEYTKSDELKNLNLTGYKLVVWYELKKYYSTILYQNSRGKARVLIGGGGGG